MVKLQFDNNKQFKLTLPKALIDAKGWKKNDLIKIELDSDGNIASLFLYYIFSQNTNNMIALMSGVDPVRHSMGVRHSKDLTAV